jgi:hypothetical protein
MKGKRGILIVGVAMMIAAAGVVYAHWQDTLQVNAAVNTGTADVNWTAVSTNDDSKEFPSTVLDGNTSRDPSGPHPGGTAAEPRYDKDVADCYAEIIEGVFVLTVNNAYPSYHCTTYSTFKNEGSVPMKVQNIVTYVNYTEDEGSWVTHQGTPCGFQIDPGEEFETINTLHIENDALQNHTYLAEQTIYWVNWNEYDQDACAITFLPLPLP